MLSCHLQGAFRQAMPCVRWVWCWLQVRHRKTVLEHWGFDRHLAMGKGVNVLFAGQSGTGKTMAAEIVASDLGLELYKIDLSTISDGKSATMHLVADGEVIDLKARAVAFAKRK